MAFEQVMLRTTDGQEFGPASMDDIIQWHRQGRVPADASLLDTATNEIRPVADFPALAISPPPTVTSAPIKSAPSATDHLIPVKNPKALAAYYCGVFGIPCFIPLGPVALIFGILGYRDAKTFGVGRTHALVGIILGGLETLAILILAITIAYGVSHPGH